MAETTRDRVRAGITWIYQNIPGGLERIDVKTLNIERYSRCALTQAVGMPYYTAARANGLDTSDRVQLGFELPGIGSSAQYRYLTRVWKEELTKPRQQAA